MTWTQNQIENFTTLERLVYELMLCSCGNPNTGNPPGETPNESWTELTGEWSGNKFLDLNSNRIIAIDKTKATGMLRVQQLAGGFHTLTVEGVELEINTEVNSFTLVAFAYVGTDLHFLISKNVISTVVDSPDIVKPTTPTLTASEITATNALLNATGATDAGSGIASYHYYKNGVFHINSLLSSYKVNGLTPETSTLWKVKAVDAAGNFSDFSNEITVTTLAADPPSETGMLTITSKQVGVTDVSEGVFNMNAGGIVSVFDQKLIGDGEIKMVGRTGQVLLFGLDDDNTLNVGENWKCWVTFLPGLGLYKNYEGGTESPIVGDSNLTSCFKIKRVGSEAKVSISEDDITYTEVFTIPIEISGELFVKMQSGSSAVTSGVLSIVNE